MDMQLPNKTENTHKDQLANIKDELNKIDVPTMVPNTIYNNALPANNTIPTLEAVIPKKTVNPNIGPLFVSLKKFNEIKSQIVILKQESSELRQLINQLKASRDSGKVLLTQAVDKMASLETSVENINTIIKI
ncbi:MAG: hypothetical protein K0B07_01340 [DPANN group archaeon]|nr:hypothetical protein [DPANN group archaeon]